jgi:hypothetical protein
VATVLSHHVKTKVWRIVAMANVSLTIGSVMAGPTVQTVLMRPIVLLYHVQTKVYGIVAMANVFQPPSFAMAQVSSATLAGLQTVPMVPMKA